MSWGKCDVAMAHGNLIFKKQGKILPRHNCPTLIFLMFFRWNIRKVTEYSTFSG